MVDNSKEIDRSFLERIKRLEVAYEKRVIRQMPASEIAEEFNRKSGREKAKEQEKKYYKIIPKM